jgi:hypothetical protein
MLHTKTLFDARRTSGKTDDAHMRVQANNGKTKYSDTNKKMLG